MPGPINDLEITANDIDLSGTLNSGTASIKLLVSDDGAIGLGDTAGNLSITGAELQNITAKGLTIGKETRWKKGESGRKIKSQPTKSNANSVLTPYQIELLK